MRLDLAHVSIARPEVQERRAGKRVPNGRWLHSYANLYLHARNAMLFDVLNRGNLAVLAVDPCVLDLDEVLVTDRNAAATLTRFLPAAEGIAQLDATAVFARYWTDSLDAKQRRQAEVLVPDRVPSALIRRAYVSDQQAVDRLRGQLGKHQLVIGSYPFLFFRSQ